MKTILWVGESSHLSTGYGVHSNELLKRFHATGKYRIVELGCYASPQDQVQVPWGFIPNSPNTNNEAEIKAFESNPFNQFGAWKFEEACLATKCDAVVDCRDSWYMHFQSVSPFRRLFNWVIQPAVDAAPQDESWIDMFSGADSVLTYSDWASGVLKEQGLKNVVGTASPGVDLETFRPPENRAALRESFGLSADSLIVGMVARNQQRKLFPDLIEAFELFLKEAPKEIAEKSYLYLHTAWPDQAGWDIPRLITESGIASKVLLTYSCRACGAVFPSFFSDARTVCVRCGKPEAGFPTTHRGVPRQAVAAITGLFDAFVQYANSEGCGIPQIEAAACGVPVFSVDYSAMSDVVRKLGGYPIKVQRKFRERETHCWRALPDNADFVHQLIEFLRLPEPVRKGIGRKHRANAQRFFSYDVAAETFMRCFDAAPQANWTSPAKLFESSKEIPQNLSDYDFVRFCLANVAGQPELINTYFGMKLARDLSWGATNGLGLQQGPMRPFSREETYRMCLEIAEKRNYWENRRVNATK